MLIGMTYRAEQSFDGAAEGRAGDISRRYKPVGGVGVGVEMDHANGPSLARLEDCKEIR